MEKVIGFGEEKKRDSKKIWWELRTRNFPLKVPPWKDFRLDDEVELNDGDEDGVQLLYIWLSECQGHRQATHTGTISEEHIGAIVCFSLNKTIALVSLHFQEKSRQLYVHSFEICTLFNTLSSLNHSFG